jgi:F0F1-type ATP synthase membrane subunit b/b'
VDAARGQAEEQTREARREVGAALDQARGTLRDDADQIAEAIADQLLGASA